MCILQSSYVCSSRCTLIKKKVSSINPQMGTILAHTRPLYPGEVKRRKILSLPRDRTNGRGRRTVLQLSHMQGRNTHVYHHTKRGFFFWNRETGRDGDTRGACARWNKMTGVSVPVAVFWFCIWDWNLVGASISSVRYWPLRSIRRCIGNRGESPRIKG